MKTLSLILLTFWVALGHSQDLFSVSLKTEPGAYKDGFNFGLALQYQNQTFYAEASLFNFPDLNGASYLDLGGSAGLNWRSRMLFWRAYGGWKGAAIFRGGQGGYALMGFEAGLEYYFTGYKGAGLFIGAGYYGASRTDSKFWSPNDDSFWTDNGVFKMGYRW